MSNPKFKFVFFLPKMRPSSYSWTQFSHTLFENRDMKLTTIMSVSLQITSCQIRFIWNRFRIFRFPRLTQNAFTWLVLIKLFSLLTWLIDITCPEFSILYLTQQEKISKCREVGEPKITNSPHKFVSPIFRSLRYSVRLS